MAGELEGDSEEDLERTEKERERRGCRVVVKDACRFLKERFFRRGGKGGKRVPEVLRKGMVDDTVRYGNVTQV